MRIVDRIEFMSLPEGTVFSYWDSEVGNDGLKKKVGNIGDDFVVQELLFEPGFKYSNDGMDASDKFIESLESGNDERNDFDCAGRDGFFDYGQKFLVYDRQDLDALIEQLR